MTIPWPSLKSSLEIHLKNSDSTPLFIRFGNNFVKMRIEVKSWVMQVLCKRDGFLIPVSILGCLAAPPTRLLSYLLRYQSGVRN